jgi:hypothetical protein
LWLSDIQHLETNYTIDAIQCFTFIINDSIVIITVNNITMNETN